MDRISGENLDRKPVAAAIVASLLMLILGVTYRAVAARLGVTWGATPLTPEMLEGFPMQIGGWTGREVPLDDAIWRKTKADAYISRRYSRNNDSGFVSLYAVAGVRARDLIAHRPDVCYPAAGWALEDQRSVELLLNDGMKLPCSVFRFRRGVLNTQEVTVLNYFVVDGQHCVDASAAISRTGRRFGGAGYVTQVQIVSVGDLTTDSAMRLVSAFAVDSASSIAQLFEDAGEDRHSDEERSDANTVYKGIESG